MSEYLCTKCINIFTAENSQPSMVCPRCGYYAGKSAGQIIKDLETEIGQLKKQIVDNYESALILLRKRQKAMKSEVGNEDLIQIERECKVMLIDLCKDIAFEFAEGIKPI